MPDEFQRCKFFREGVLLKPVGENNFAERVHVGNAVEFEAVSLRAKVGQCERLRGLASARFLRFAFVHLRDKK